MPELTPPKYRQVCDMLTNIDVRDCREREAQFVKDQQARQAEYGSSMFMSEKQFDWLKSIYERQGHTLDDSDPNDDVQGGPEPVDRKIGRGGAGRRGPDDDIPF